MGKKIAIITPMPPIETGIARFSEQAFKNKERFDIFSWTGENHNSIDSIWAAMLNKRYKAVLFVLGNSDHMVNVARVMRKFIGFPGVHIKLAVEIHDPVLMNLAEKTLQEEGIEFLRYYKNLASSNAEINTSCIYEAYEDHQITGLSALIKGINISSCIVHSNSAAQIVSQELKAYASAHPIIHSTFHPCFDAKEAEEERSKKEFDIGIFGVLDNGGKMTGKALEVVRKAHSLGLVSSCVCAGFNADNYFEANPEALSEWIRVVNHPSDSELKRIMSQTRVALHPRLLNTGESSGIIPILLSSNYIPIVSDIGSFSEYPDGLVIKINNTRFEKETIKAIQIAMKQENDHKIINDLIASRSPMAFSDLVYQALT